MSLLDHPEAQALLAEGDTDSAIEYLGYTATH